MNIHRLRNIVPRPVAAVAAAGLALAVAGPAFAEPNQPPARKGCAIQFQGPGAGQSIVYPDGYSFSVKASNDGKTHTYTCSDGRWIESVSLTGGTVTRNLTILGTAGALRPVQR